MAKPLSLFTTYQSKENRVTNYCGLMLTLLYKENPGRFEDAINELLEEQTSISCGPVFIQQKKQNQSIPDLIILQEPFRIFFENKLSDWNSEAQIKRHLEGFKVKGEYEKNILFLLSNDFRPETFQIVKNACNEKRIEKVSIYAQLITYRRFCDVLKHVSEGLSAFYCGTLEDFERFLNQEELLNSWKQRLASVLMSQTQTDISNGLYQCSLDKKAIKQRCHYFGAYWEKQIQKLGSISAVLLYDPSNNEYSVDYKNVDKEDETLIETARSRLQKCGYNFGAQSDVKQIFLVDDLSDVKIPKTSPGPQWGRVVYADTECDSLCDLKSRINEKTTYELLVSGDL